MVSARSIVFALCLFSAPAVFADAPERGAAEANPQAMTVRGYPARWRLESHAIVRPPRPIASTPRRRNQPADIDDATNSRRTLAEYLRAIEGRRLLTLWRGQNRSLVVGFQNGGYFGVSLGITPKDED